MERTKRKIRCYQITSEGITTGWMLKEEWLNSVQDYLIQEWQEEMTRILDLKDMVNNEELYSDEDWDEKMILLEEARKFALSTTANTAFTNFLFTRIMPNLSRIGLLTDKVRPKFEALGLLEYEHAPDDFECVWNELEKPLEKFGEIPQVI